MNEFATWGFIATFAGATLLTGIVTHFIKRWVDKYLKVPTQVLAVIICYILLISSNFFLGSLTPSLAVLSVFNAIIIASTASNTVSFADRNKGK